MSDVAPRPPEQRTGNGPGLAVTTRSRLKRLRFCAPMLCASARIGRQLAACPGCIRYASIVTGPREFWTISVWQSRDAMQEFVRSGPHESLMWNFSKWFESFWLMRWSPTATEQGHWGGATMASAARSGPPPAEPQAAGVTTLGDLPQLTAAMGPHGAPSYDHAPEVRRARRRVGGSTGATVRVEVAHLWDAPEAWRRLRLVRNLLAGNPDVLALTTGVTRPTELFALVVLRDGSAWEQLDSCPPLRDLRARWPDRTWVMRWKAEHEFGHWDGLRVRRTRLRAGIPFQR